MSQPVPSLPCRTLAWGGARPSCPCPPTPKQSFSLHSLSHCSGCDGKGSVRCLVTKVSEWPRYLWSAQTPNCFNASPSHFLCPFFLPSCQHLVLRCSDWLYLCPLSLFISAGLSEPILRACTSVMTYLCGVQQMSICFGSRGQWWQYGHPGHAVFPCCGAYL